MASFAEWHLIQFTADMRRREPRNIGVAASVDGEAWELRLFGVDSQTHAVDGRSLRRMQLTKEDYEGWTEYYRVMLNDGGPERIRQSQQRRPTEFRLVTGGHTELAESLREFTDKLYSEMVEATPEQAESHSQVLHSKVEQVLHTADIAPSVDIVVPGKWGDAEDDIPFDYAFTNGQRHIMDRIQLHQGSLEKSKVIARDFNARVRAAMDAESGTSFIAFYSQSVVDELGTDAVLAPLWRVAHTVDVDNVDLAVGNLLDYVHAV